MLLGLFLLIFLPLLFIKFSVELQFDTVGLNSQFTVRFGLGRFFLTLPTRLLNRLRKRFPGPDLTSVKTALESLRLFFRIFDNLLQKIVLFRLEILFSSGDPFWTSLGVGGMWAGLGPFLTGLSVKDKFVVQPEIVIQPDYGEANFQVHFHCIFQFRLGQIIINELKRASLTWFA